MSEQLDDRPPIRLDQFLKLTGMAETGGHAKLMIQGGDVTVNGVVEIRRSKKLSPGDRVACAGREEIVD